MRTARVTVVPYDDAWPSAFEHIKNEIDAALGDLTVAIEHVGSTSVRGMYAKPCIDIDVVIGDHSPFCEVVLALQGIGYIHEGDLGIPGREAFGYTDKPHLMQHHLYVCRESSEELARHIKFRDFLRCNKAAAERYSRIKREAAERFPDDIDKYIQYKSPCIEDLYAECGLIIR